MVVESGVQRALFAAQSAPASIDGRACLFSIAQLQSEHQHQRQLQQPLGLLYGLPVPPGTAHDVPNIYLVSKCVFD
jgi:hypothetical protein